MSEQSLWQRLTALVEFDQQVISLENRINELSQQINALSGQIPSATEKLTRKELAFKESRKKVDGLELRAKELSAQETEKKKALDQVKNQKEYGALNTEIAKIQQERSQLDDELVTAWHQVETITKELEAEKTASLAAQEQLSSTKSTQEAERDSLNKELSEKSGSRPELAAAIPAEWLARYERMKRQVSNPIVPVVGDNCSACYYQILPQNLLKLKREGLVLCQNCYRFLYQPETPPSPTPAK